MKGLTNFLAFFAIVAVILLVVTSVDFSIEHPADNTTIDELNGSEGICIDTVFNWDGSEVYYLGRPCK